MPGLDAAAVAAAVKKEIERQQEAINYDELPAEQLEAAAAASRDRVRSAASECTDELGTPAMAEYDKAIRAVEDRIAMLQRGMYAEELGMDRYGNRYFLLDAQPGVTVIGAGRLGLCWGLCVEKAGFAVKAVDIFPSYVEAINTKTLTSQEPQLMEMLQASTRLEATLSLAEGVARFLEWYGSYYGVKLPPRKQRRRPAGPRRLRPEPNSGS